MAPPLAASMGIGCGLEFRTDILYNRAVSTIVWLAQGVYQSDHIPSMMEAVEQGVLMPNQIRFFAGYAGWTAGQLAWEVESGTWWVAAASSSLIRDCLQGINLSPWMGPAPSWHHAAIMPNPVLSVPEVTPGKMFYTHAYCNSCYCLQASPHSPGKVISSGCIPADVHQASSVRHLVGRRGQQQPHL